MSGREGAKRAFDVCGLALFLGLPERLRPFAPPVALLRVCPKFSGSLRAVLLMQRLRDFAGQQVGRAHVLGSLM